jgi:hypothetical protein
MAKSKYQTIDLAARQLETAIFMFLRGQDRFSVITLAGAASGILTQLVLNSGKQPFVDYARLLQSKLNSPTIPPRDKFNRHINDRFGVNALRHHAPNDPPTINLDEKRAAEKAITRAVADYIELRGQSEPFVIAFLNWTWMTRDGPTLMAEYEAQPKAIKALKK